MGDDGPPTEVEKWLLGDFDNAVQMIQSQLERARTEAQVSWIETTYAPNLLGMFRKMFGKGLAGEADKALQQAQARVAESVAKRRAELQPKTR